MAKIAANATELMQNETEAMVDSARTEMLGAGDETDSSFTGGFLQIGELIEGWKVTSKLNIKSGEAEVYRAQKDGEEGIVKYYRSMIVDPNSTVRQKEILEKIRGLNHSDIINLHSFGLHKRHLFEIMEYAAGGALDSKNEDGSYKYLPLSEEDVIGVCEEVINAYKDCHKLGVIHRDIKPGNIYYRKCEEIPGKKGKFRGSDIVIADFGISSVMDESEQYHKTSTASRTSSYAAPEVLFGEINGKYDYYALGVTLWELAMGKEPYVTENGTRLDPNYVMQLSIQGLAADNLLRTKPLLSKKLQYLIRGLLVIKPENRWGYEEVTDYLAGKDVDIKEQEKSFKYVIGDKTCTNFDELAETIMENPGAVHKAIFQGRISAALSRTFPEKAKEIDEIAEEASSKGNELNGIYKIAWTLSLKVPLKTKNGYEARSLDDIKFLIANAPEAMLPLLRDKDSWFYIYLEVRNKTEQSEAIKKQAETLKAIAASCGDAELIAKAQVILNNRRIQPFKLKKYQDYILDTPENLSRMEIPEDLQKRILSLIAEENYEGLIYPWMDLHLKELGITKYAPKTWKELIDLFEKAA